MPQSSDIPINKVELVEGAEDTGLPRHEKKHLMRLMQLWWVLLSLCISVFRKLGFERKALAGEMRLRKGHFSTNVLNIFNERIQFSHRVPSLPRRDDCLRYQNKATFSRMWDDFKLMASASRADSIYVHKKTSEKKMDKIMLENESRFLDDFFALMRFRGFQLITTDEWEDARAEEFLVSQPVNIAWENLDNEFLGRYWKLTPADRERYADRAAFTDRCLLFHKGVGVMTRPKGLYMKEKIDLLMEYVVIQPLMRLSAKVFRSKGDELVQTLFGRAPERAQSGVGPDPSPSPSQKRTMFANNNRSQYSIAPQRPDATPLHGPPASRPVSPVLPAPETADLDPTMQRIERRNFRSLMPDSMSVLVNLFNKLEPSEPTYKEVIVLYRRQKPIANNNPIVPNLKGIHVFEAPLETGGAPGYTPPPSLNLYIEAYRDLPMADLEIAFPEKRVMISSTSYVSLLVNVVVLFVSFVTLMVTTRARLTYLATPLLALLYRVYAQYNALLTERGKIEDALTTMNLLQFICRQEGVLSWLTDGTTDQILSEMIVAYSILLAAGRDSVVPDQALLTIHEVEAQANNHLLRHFGYDAAVSLKNALDILEKLGAIDARGVAVSGQGAANGGGPGATLAYRAHPIAHAIAAALKKWGTIHVGAQAYAPPPPAAAPSSLRGSSRLQVGGRSVRWGEDSASLQESLRMSNGGDVGPRSSSQVLLPGGAFQPEQILVPISPAVSGIPDLSASPLSPTDPTRRKVWGLFKTKDKDRVGGSGVLSQAPSLSLQERLSPTHQLEPLPRAALSADSSSSHESPAVPSVVAAAAGSAGGRKKRDSLNFLMHMKKKK